MGSKIVAGEPVDVLLRALRQIRFRKTASGWVHLSATLTRELGEPLERALRRIELELLDQDRVHRNIDMRTRPQRQTDALVVLADRLAEAMDAT